MDDGFIYYYDGWWLCLGTKTRRDRIVHTTTVVLVVMVGFIHASFYCVFVCLSENSRHFSKIALLQHVREWITWMNHNEYLTVHVRLGQLVMNIHPSISYRTRDHRFAIRPAGVDRQAGVTVSNVHTVSNVQYKTKQYPKEYALRSTVLVVLYPIAPSAPLCTNLLGKTYYPKNC